MAMYYGIERRPALGAVTSVPIVSTVVFLVATILSVTVGIGTGPQ